MVNRCLIFSGWGDTWRRSQGPGNIPALMQWLQVIKGHTIVHWGNSHIQKTYKSPFFSPGQTPPPSDLALQLTRLWPRVFICKPGGDQAPICPADSTIEGSEGCLPRQITANDCRTFPPKACKGPHFVGLLWDESLEEGEGRSNSSRQQLLNPAWTVSGDQSAWPV